MDIFRNKQRNYYNAENLKAVTKTRKPIYYFFFF